MDVLSRNLFYIKALENIKDIDNLINFKNKVSVYYGTNDTDRGVLDPIDPIFCINNGEDPSVYEFGIGFYLSPSLEIALGYTYGSLPVNLLSDIDNLKSLSNGESKKFNLHSYDIDFSLNNMNIEKCLFISNFKNELKKTITGYRKYKYYNKDVDLTVGLMCGHFWDKENISYEKFIKNPRLKNDNGIKTFIENCINSMTLIKNNSGKTDIPIQYCIHRDVKLLSNKKYCEFTNIEIFEMLFEELNYEDRFYHLSFDNDRVMKRLFEKILKKIDKEGVDLLW